MNRKYFLSAGILYVLASLFNVSLLCGMERDDSSFSRLPNHLTRYIVLPKSKRYRDMVGSIKMVNNMRATCRRLNALFIDDTALMKSFLQSNSIKKVNEYNADGDTPLWLAVAGNNPQEVYNLIEAGADPDKRHKVKWTPFENAAREDLLNICSILLDGGADINKSAHYLGWTALHTASSRNKLNTVQFLLEHNADVSTKDSRGQTARNVATENEDTLKLLDAAQNILENPKQI